MAQRGRPAGVSNAPTRPPVPEELSEAQKRIYELLPKDAKELYLSTLPPIRDNKAERDRKIAIIEKAITREKAVITALSAHVASMEKTVSGLKDGQAVSTITARDVVSLPEIPGVLLRFARTPKEEAAE